MSLRINHNIAALNAHRNLVNTNEELQNSMQRLSSGYRINRGADDPAGLVISEQFRAQIAGLNRAIGNSEGSISMIQTAEGALTEINNLLISMRELAIHAANEGFNDADQLAADQAEIQNALKTIDRIAANTQFGTKKLLDGSKENVATITGANYSGATIKTSGLSTGTHYLTSTKVADAEASINVSNGGFTLAGTAGDPYNLEEKVYNLDVVQASGGATVAGTSDVAITDSFGNGLQFSSSGSAAVMLANTAISTHSGSTDLVYSFSVNFQEAGTAATGNVSFNVTMASGDGGAALRTAFDAALVGTALEGKISSTGAGDTFGIAADNTGAHSIAWETVTETGGTAQFTLAKSENRGTQVGSVQFTNATAAHTDGSAQTVTMASSATVYTTMADLVTAMNTQITSDIGAVAGTSTDSDIYASTYQGSKISFATRDMGSDYNIRVSGGNADFLNVLGVQSATTATAGIDARISFDGHSNTISAVDYDQTMSGIKLYNGTVGESTTGNITIDIANSEGGLEIGSYLLDSKATKFDVRLDGGAAQRVTAGHFNTIYNNDRSEWLDVKYSLTSEGGSEVISNSNQALTFQIGANVGQTAAISLRNMASTALGRYNTGNMFSNLSEVDVTTVSGAQDAQSVIDAAINEVSTTRGTLGSFQKNTLESNLRNLRIASQNLSASESQIRDTDMAKEMSVFTKNQILIQAGTSMLAQANQLPQVVLSLF